MIVLRCVECDKRRIEHTEGTTEVTPLVACLVDCWCDLPPAVEAA